MPTNEARKTDSLIRWLDEQQAAQTQTNDYALNLPIILEEKNTAQLILHYQSRLDSLNTPKHPLSREQVQAVLPLASHSTRRKLSGLLLRWSEGNHRHLRNYASFIITKEHTNSKHTLNNLNIARALYNGDIEDATKHICDSVGAMQWAARRELRNLALPQIISGSAYTTSKTPLHKKLSHSIIGAYKKFSKNTWLSLSTSTTPSSLLIIPKLPLKKQKTEPGHALTEDERRFKKSLFEAKQRYKQHFLSTHKSIQSSLPKPQDLELALINNDQKTIQAAINCLRFMPLPAKILDGNRKPPYNLINQLSKTLELRVWLSWEGAHKVAESIKK